MIRFLKTGTALLAALLLAWLLPWLFSFVTAEPAWRPFTLYSCVVHSFASLDHGDDGSVVGRDMRGTTYTESQFDSILPMFYYRQLAAEGRFPSQIEGVPVTVRDAERSGFIFRTSPSDVNRPAVGIYQILESMPARVDFDAPSDVFRITESGIEFVDMETNTTDEAKSSLFTEVMRRKGFRFPARMVAGNPTPKKEYDNGCLVVDAAGALYHMKQMRGRPFFRAVPLPDGFSVGRIFVTEYPDRRHLAFLTDTAGHFYAMRADDYSLHEVAVGGFDPTTESMMIIGDMFYWTVNIESGGAERLVAVDARDYSVVEVRESPAEPSRWERAARFAFPFELSFTSVDDAFVRPRVAAFSPSALWAGAVLAALYLLLRRRSLRGGVWRAAGIVLLGIYLFIPLLLLEPRR